MRKMHGQTTSKFSKLMLYVNVCKKYRVLRFTPSWAMKDFFPQDNESEFIGFFCPRYSK